MGDQSEILSGLVGFHLRRASSAFVSDFARSLTGMNIRQVLFGVLTVIKENPDIQQGEVGRRLGIQRANMVSLVNELVEQGLVARSIAKDDRRAFALSLTAEGERTVKRCLGIIREHEARMLANLSDSERSALIDLLARIRGNTGFARDEAEPMEASTAARASARRTGQRSGVSRV